MDLSIIIVNYNTSELVKDCVQSIYQHTNETLIFEIIVVDNASKKSDVEKLKQLKGITLIEAGDNLGFGRGNNLGAQNAKGEYILLLNSDTLLIEDSLNILFKTFKKYKDELNLGALGCELVDKNLIPNGSYFNFTNAKQIIKDSYSFIFSKFYNQAKKETVKIEEFNANGLLKVDYIIGADILMPRELYKQVGGFDPDYFMYFEEADLQLKLEKLGYTRYITNATRIIHIGGASTDNQAKLSNQRRILIQKGRNLYLKKNDSFYPFYVMSDFVYSILRLFNQNYTIKENLNFIKENFKSY